MNNYSFPLIEVIYNRRGNASPTKAAAVELRITYRRRQKYMSLHIYLYPNQFRNGTITNRPDAAILNKMVAEVKNEVFEIILDMFKDGFIDIWAVPARLDKKRKQVGTFIDYCRQRAEVRKHGLRSVSAGRYDRFIRFLEEWGGIVSYDDITDHNILAMDAVLVKRKLMASSRWNNYHRFMVSFILDAQAEGLVHRNPYKFIRIDRCKTPGSINKILTPEEFEKWKAVKLGKPSLERVRDLFIFQTYTAFSFVEMERFNYKKIKTINGEKVYVGQRGKTGETFTVILLQPALDILAKYKNRLPIISNVDYNKYLKDVAKAAGISKHITSHWARHTGATLLLNSGLPMKVVSKVLGHSTTKITETTYAKLLDETVIKEIKKVKSKIK